MIEIAGRKIGPHELCYVIAEAGGKMVIVAAIGLLVMAVVLWFALDVWEGR